MAVAVKDDYVKIRRDKIKGEVTVWLRQLFTITL